MGKQERGKRAAFTLKLCLLCLSWVSHCPSFTGTKHSTSKGSMSIMSVMFQDGAEAAAPEAASQ